MSGKKSLGIIFLLLLVLGIGIVGGIFIAKKSSPPKQETSTEKQLYSCGMHPEIIQEGPGNCPICGMKLTPVKGTTTTAEAKPTGERKVKFWKSSMDPTFVDDKPGKDNMGMDLIPVYEDEVQEGAISIDPVTIQNMGLRTALVEESKLSRIIRTVGHVDYNERLLHTINSKISGWIEKLYVQNTGDPVKKGEALLEIYAPELVSTQEEYLTSLKNFQELKNSPYAEAKKGATELLQSAKQRLLNWDISPEQIDHLEKTGLVKKTFTLYSPANGVVVEKNVIPGDFVESGKDLFKIADLSTIWILAHIYEYELPFVKVGQSAKLETPYSPGEELFGKVSYIYPYLDETSRDAKVRIELPNPGLRLKPQMYANVVISAELPGKKIVVPEEAVIRSGKREIVFVDLGEGKFSPREVVTGVTGEKNLIEIKQGLVKGEKVVVSAQFMLDSESKTQEAIKKMLESKKETSVQTEESVKPQAETQKEEPKNANLNLTPDKMAKSAQEVYTCPMDEHSHILQVGPGDCPECGMKLVPITTAGRQVFSCPMEEHHNILSDKKGKCPECGMELVPLKKE